MRTATEFVQLRLTPEQKELLKGLAADYKLNTTEFVVSMAEYIAEKRPILKIRPADKPYRTGKRTGVRKGDSAGQGE